MHTVGNAWGTITVSHMYQIGVGGVVIHTDHEPLAATVKVVRQNETETVVVLVTKTVYDVVGYLQVERHTVRATGTVIRRSPVLNGLRNAMNTWKEVCAEA